MLSGIGKCCYPLTKDQTGGILTFSTKKKLWGSIEGQLALAGLSTLLDGLPRLQILDQVSQSPDRVRNLLDDHLSLSFLVRLDFHNNKISNVLSYLS